MKSPVAGVVGLSFAHQRIEHGDHRLVGVLRVARAADRLRRRGHVAAVDHQLRCAGDAIIGDRARQEFVAGRPAPMENRPPNGR